MLRMVRSGKVDAGDVFGGHDGYRSRRVAGYGRV